MWVGLLTSLCSTRGLLGPELPPDSGSGAAPQLGTSRWQWAGSLCRKCRHATDLAPLMTWSPQLPPGKKRQPLPRPPHWLYVLRTERRPALGIACSPSDPRRGHK